MIEMTYIQSRGFDISRDFAIRRLLVNRGRALVFVDVPALNSEMS